MNGGVGFCTGFGGLTGAAGVADAVCMNALTLRYVCMSDALILMLGVAVATLTETVLLEPLGMPGAGTCGEPKPSGMVTCLAFGDQPAAMDFRTASHLSMCVVARPNTLWYPNGCMH